MKYYIIAGEASGDMHGANLLKNLKKFDTQADFRYWGGDLMQAQGGVLVKHYRDLAFMGIVEVVANLPTILKNFKFCRKEIMNYRPDVLILIDYAGFNLKMAKFAHQNGIKVFFYISPKIWAWKRSRIKEIKKNVDRMFTILPFETEFYHQYDYTVDYVGNPVVDAVDDFLTKAIDINVFRKENNLPGENVIALLAGSRKQEIRLLLPHMLSLVKHYPGHKFVIAGAPSIPDSYYHSIIGDENVSIVYDKTYDLLRCAEAAIVTSGTATLETALFEVPQVVVYKTSAATFNIGKFLIAVGHIHVTFFSLVNLILHRELVKELLQYNLDKDIKTELDKILEDPVYKEDIIQGYKEMKHILGKAGSSEKAARLMIKYLTNEDAKVAN